MDALDQRSKEMKNEPPNFTSTVQRPFFGAIDRRNLAYVYAGLALSSLKLSGSEGWTENPKSAKALERYRTWMQSQTAKPKGK
jgi:hypothetical protein